MPKVLITGCAGFIGYKVCEIFLKNKFEVIGIDNFDPYYDISLKEYRIEQLRNYENFKFILADIRDKEVLRNIFRIYDFESVINLSAKAGVRASIVNPKEYFEVNIFGTLNLLELMREFNVNKFILASTSSIYAGHKPPFSEELKCDEMISPYAVSKKSAENLAYNYYYLYGINTIILRYFTVYGPAGRPDMSIFRFLYFAIKNQEITIYGDGTQRRSFSYVDDIAYGTFLAYSLKDFQLINLGNDEDNSVNEVLDIIKNFLSKELRIKYEPFHKADIYETKADISRAKKLLNWKPKIKLKEGIENTLNWFLENRELIDKLRI